MASEASGWLQAIGLQKYGPHFEAAKVETLRQVHALDETRLREMGVTVPGHVRRILLAQAELEKQLVALALEAGQDDEKDEDVDEARDVLRSPQYNSAFSLGIASAAPSAKAAAAAAAAAATSCGALPAAAPRSKFNSTSSLYIYSTISTPDVHEIVFCVAVVLLDRIGEGEEARAQAQAQAQTVARAQAQAAKAGSAAAERGTGWLGGARRPEGEGTGVDGAGAGAGVGVGAGAGDGGGGGGGGGSGGGDGGGGGGGGGGGVGGGGGGVDPLCDFATAPLGIRSKPLHVLRAPNDGDGGTAGADGGGGGDGGDGVAALTRTAADAHLKAECESSEELTEVDIFRAVKTIHEQAGLSSEVLIIALLFTERLRQLAGLPLLLSNWQPIFVTALLVAQKVWDDASLLNLDFATVVAPYTVSELNAMELRFLTLIEYNVAISAKTYAAYYFELRTLCEKEERAFSLKPLSTAEASRLQSKTAAMEEGLKSAGVRREWASSAR
ncbi:hypothetical protein KFE25_011237 [Diacronema lutheri]|uniref:SAM domain-containing protein n=1 Tax=Diacronema lutheri TaxID=2081491 RepID=A0A8J5XPT6_DIALT|nr:hypothetical protein KFE25_011237 [Diacronema lutheri]